jgi:hypothetical protein
MKNLTAFILVWLGVGTISGLLIWRDHYIMGFVLVGILLCGTTIRDKK